MSRDAVVGLLQPYIRFSENEAPGNNVAAYCPFHKDGKEKSPSFYVYVGPKSFRKSPGSAFCHTCNRGWTLPSLLRDLGAGYAKASEIIEVLDVSPVKPHPIRSLDFEMDSLPEAILGAFDYTPKSLVEAGFSERTLADFEIGFDRRRKRVTFPIRNHLGSLVGVSGRTVVNEVPRYKIYRKELHEIQPNYELKKGRVLWNLHSFYNQSLITGLDKPVIVTEGFKAAMWVAQCGFKQTVALLGVHLTREQKFLLTSVANKVILFLDNDKAGQEGTRRIVNLLSKELDVSIASYPDRHKPTSPDDLSKKQVITAIKTAETPLERMIYEQSQLARLSSRPPSTQAEAPEQEEGWRWG